MESTEQAPPQDVPFCEWCEATEQLSVDHVIPVSERPDLAYKVENCRVLCLSCNGKRANQYTDDERGTVLKRLRDSTTTRAKLTPPNARKPPSEQSQTRGGTPYDTVLRRWARRGRRYTPLGGVCEGQPSRNPESEYLGTGALRISRLMVAVCDHFLPNIGDGVMGLSTTGSRHFEDATLQDFVGVFIAVFVGWKVRVAHCECHVWSLP